MALSPEDLEQVRNLVRLEFQQNPPSTGIGRILLIGLFAFIGLFVAVLGLHILVIGGFTVYHLMHS